MANQQLGFASISPRPMRRKIIMINDFPVDVTPLPGRHYTRATWPPRKRGRGMALDHPSRIQALLKAAQAMELYFECGYTWQHVADTLGYADRSGAWRAVRRLADRQDFNAGRVQFID